MKNIQRWSWSNIMMYLESQASPEEWVCDVYLFCLFLYICGERGCCHTNVKVYDLLFCFCKIQRCISFTSEILCLCLRGAIHWGDNYYQFVVYQHQLLLNRRELSVTTLDSISKKILKIFSNLIFCLEELGSWLAFKVFYSNSIMLLALFYLSLTNV